MLLSRGISPIEISPLNEWSIDSTAVMQNLSIQLEVYFHWNQGYSGPKCKGMHVIFQKNDKKGKKRAKCLKIRQKCTKFKNILKKGSLMCATIACIKQLDYALVLHLRYIIEIVLLINYWHWHWSQIILLTTVKY